MLGAIIGDVAGSNYEVLEVRHLKKYHIPRSYEERIKILDKGTPLFTKESTATDDSVLTCAIYDAIKNGNCEYEKYLREYGLREINMGQDSYGRSRFGKGFVEWLQGYYQGTSYGNGSAMRISPIGFLFNTIDDIKKNSRLATIPSHNHEESLKASESVALAIFLLRSGKTKEEVINYIKNNYYDLNFDLETLQRVNTFSSKASITVPQAFYIFSISDSFEDSIRKAISIGGDSDTIAAIVGSLSESYYGIPDELKEKVKPYLLEYMYELLKDRYFEERKLSYERDSRVSNRK